MQQAGTGRDVVHWVSLASNAARRRSGRLRREQVVLEGAMVAAASDPHARATQAIAQDGKHGRLVQAPIWNRPGEDHPAPLGREERRWKPLGQDAGAALVRCLEQIDSGEQRVMRDAGLEAKGSQESRAEAPHDGIFLGRRGQDLHVGHAGHSVGHRQGLIELGQSHLALDRGNALFAGLLGPCQGGDSAAEQE